MRIIIEGADSPAVLGQGVAMAPKLPSPSDRRRWQITDMAQRFFGEGQTGAEAVAKAKSFFDALDAALGPEPEE